jgi:TonB family protein
VRTPDGWTLVEDEKPAVNRNKGLFVLHEAANSRRLITVSTEDATGLPGIYQVDSEQILEAMVKDSIQKFANPISDLQGRRVGIGGQEFARSDFQSKNKSEYWSALVAIVRGNVVKVSISSDSRDSLHELVQVLMGSLRFDPDWSSSEPEPPLPKDGKIYRVRVSQGVSEGLLIRKIAPEYPSDARGAHVQGQVVLQAVIGTDGKIKFLWVLNGDPLLTPSAVNAVKQWEYKPYYLQGQPVSVETKITVNYTLVPR